MTDCKNLDLARQWAEDIDADRQTLSQDTIDAAADLISSLPDAWVSVDTLRKYISDWREGLATAPRGNYEGEMLDDLEDMLPAPPAPRTMAEIEWDDAEHHLAEATAAWTEGHPSNVVMLNKFGKKITAYQSASHYSGLRELNPGILTPTGRKYRLEPEVDDPKFNPHFTYTDRDGHLWRWSLLYNSWACDDEHGNILRVEAIPPSKYGPYTRIEDTK